MPDNPLEKVKISIEPAPDRPSSDPGPVTPTPFSHRLAWSILAGGLIVLTAVGLFWVNHSNARAPRRPGSVLDPGLLREIPNARFTDITSSAGIRFTHSNGAYGEKLLPETTGGGCAFFDYDNDGFPDLLFVNST